MNAPRTRPRPRLSCWWTLLLLAVLACEAPEQEPLTFRYHLISAPSTLDPAVSGDVYSSGIIDRLFDGLMRLDRVRNTPELELAAEKKVSSDGLLYEFRLSEDARFHNGRRIVASDFKYSWERLLAPDLNSPKAWYFDLVEGVDDYRKGEDETVVGIEAEDPDILRIRLREPFSPFLYHLAHPTTSVVPREDVERLGDDFGRRPVDSGSGPYRFVSWENARVTLAAFEDHPRHKPQVKRLVYEIVNDADEALRLYQAGELDLVTQLPVGSLPTIQQSFAADLRTFPGTFWYGFCFRCDREPFDDPRVRRAFSLAVDRDALVVELGELRRTASVGFLPQSIPGHEPSTLTSGYDLDRARELLAEAGYPQGQGFPSQAYVAVISENNARITNFLVAAFSDLGTEVTSEAMEFSSLLTARNKGGLAWFFRGWGGKYPDPDPYFRPLFHSLGSDNTMAYSNPDVDRLLDAARKQQDEEQRLALYREAEELIREDAPCVVLYHAAEAVLLRSRWKNVPIGYDPRYFEIELAELAKEGS